MNKKAIKKHQLYNLDYELAKIIHQALKDFKKANGASDYDVLDNKTLDEMIKGFSSIVKDAKSSLNDPLQQKLQRKALQLFAEHFRRLWI